MKKISKLLRIVVPTIGALLVGVLVVFGTSLVRNQLFNQLEEPVSGLPEIVSEEELSMDGLTTETEQYAVSALAGCYDSNHTLVAYKVTMTTVGFNEKSPISMAVVISADGEVVRNISILKQKESKYYGDNIKYPDFQNQFENRHLPVLLEGEGGRGAHVDGVSNATISSKAVVGAVNWASELVSTLGGN